MLTSPASKSDRLKIVHDGSPVKSVSHSPARAGVHEMEIEIRSMSVRKMLFENIESVCLFLRKVDGDKSEKWQMSKYLTFLIRCAFSCIKRKTDINSHLVILVHSATKW